MTDLTARLAGDLIALTRSSAPERARTEQIGDVLAGHSVYLQDDAPLRSLAQALDAIASQAIGSLASHLGLAAREPNPVSLGKDGVLEGHSRVYWVREDGRSEQRWVADVPVGLLRQVADEDLRERDLDEWILKHGVLLTASVDALDQDDATFYRAGDDWLFEDEFDDYRRWPEGTNPLTD